MTLIGLLLHFLFSPARDQLFPEELHDDSDAGDLSPEVELHSEEGQDIADVDGNDDVAHEIDSALDGVDSIKCLVVEPGG